MSLIDTFQSHADVLKAKSSTFDAIRHAGNRGSEREKIVEEFLLPLLPEKIGIGNGEIRSSAGSFSNQEDLILYDRINCPRLFVGTSSQIFPAESVSTVVEVKTTLRTKDIKEASSNISNARKMVKTGMSTHVGAGNISFAHPTPIMGCLFAFNLGLKEETFMKNWAEIQLMQPPEHRINLTCILNKMVILHIDKTFHLWDQTNEELLNKFVFANAGENSLMMFTLVLLRVMGEYKFGAPDLFKYFFSGNSGVKFSHKYVGLNK